MDGDAPRLEFEVVVADAAQQRARPVDVADVVDADVPVVAGPVEDVGEAAGGVVALEDQHLAMGVAGVHGTVEEPLNNCFPSRRFAVDYAEGATLAEAYLRHMPFVYWRNLVLGDPMAAPWAHRPRVTVSGVNEGETLTASRAVTVVAEPPEGAQIAATVLYVDGVEAARAAGDRVTHCLAGDGARELLAVAQVAEDNGAGRHAPKGWTRVRVTLRGATGTCEAADAAADAPPDAQADAAADVATADAAVARGGDGGGCGCRAQGTTRGGVTALWLVAVLGMLRRRGRPHKAPRLTPAGGERRIAGRRTAASRGPLGASYALQHVPGLTPMPVS